MTSNDIDRFLKNTSLTELKVFTKRKQALTNEVGKNERRLKVTDKRTNKLRIKF